MTQAISFQRLMVCLVSLLLAGPAHGQALVSTTDTMSMDFGYPLLKANDDLTFIDENENGQIDPGEGCAITFTLLNKSRYPARDVVIRPKELNNLAGLIWREELKIGNIAAAGSRSIEVGIIAQDSIGVGTANFAFTVLEGNAVESATVVYSVPVNFESPPSDDEQAQEEEAAAEQEEARTEATEDGATEKETDDQ